MLKVLCIVILGLISIGCSSHTVVRNMYKPATITINNTETVAFSLEPTVNNSTQGVTVYGEPYQLEVLVPYKNGAKSIALKNLTLKGKNGTVISLPNKIINIQNTEGTKILTIDIEELEYRPYTLVGEIVLEYGADFNSFPVEVVLDTDYKEDEINRLWEALMGI